MIDLPGDSGLAGWNLNPYGGGHGRYPPCRCPKSKRITRPNYSPFVNKMPNNSAYFSLGLMSRLAGFIVIVLAVSACQSSQPRDMVMGRERICRKHHIPLVVARMFTTRPGLLVHYHEERCIQCEEKSPNHIITYYSLVRTELHHIPTTFPYCPRCEEEFRRCAGDTPCYDADLTKRWSERLAASVLHFP
jgi:hypothetical protein